MIWLLFFADIFAVMESASESGPTRPKNMVKIKIMREMPLETAVTPVDKPTVEKAETDSNKALIPKMSAAWPISFVK